MAFIILPVYYIGLVLFILILREIIMSENASFSPIFSGYSPYTCNYHICRKYSGRKALANSVDPDEMPHNAASHLGLHCL